MPRSQRIPIGACAEFGDGHGMARLTVGTVSQLGCVFSRKDTVETAKRHDEVHLGRCALARSEQRSTRSTARPSVSATAPPGKLVADNLILPTSNAVSRSASSTVLDQYGRWQTAGRTSDMRRGLTRDAGSTFELQERHGGLSNVRMDQKPESTACPPRPVTPRALMTVFPRNTSVDLMSSPFGGLRLRSRSRPSAVPERSSSRESAATVDRSPRRMLELRSEIAWYAPNFPRCLVVVLLWARATRVESGRSR